MFQQVLCFCRERPRPWSTQQLHILVSPHFSDTSQRPHQTYMIYSFCTVSGFTLKSTHAFVHFHLMTTQVPRRLISVAKADRRNSKQSCPKWKVIPWLFFFSSFKFIPCRQPGLFFSSAVLWNLISGWLCVHQGSHHSCCADTSPSQGLCC